MQEPTKNDRKRPTLTIGSDFFPQKRTNDKYSPTKATQNTSYNSSDFSKLDDCDLEVSRIMAMMREVELGSTRKAGLDPSMMFESSVKTQPSNQVSGSVAPTDLEKSQGIEIKCPRPGP